MYSIFSCSCLFFPRYFNSVRNDFVDSLISMNAFFRVIIFFGIATEIQRTILLDISFVCMHSAATSQWAVTNCLY